MPTLETVAVFDITELAPALTLTTRFIVARLVPPVVVNKGIEQFITPGLPGDGVVHEALTAESETNVVPGGNGSVTDMPAA
jgi:hypothetical protein